MSGCCAAPTHETLVRHPGRCSGAVGRLAARRADARVSAADHDPTVICAVIACAMRPDPTAITTATADAPSPSALESGRTATREMLRTRCGHLPCGRQVPTQRSRREPTGFFRPSPAVRRHRPSSVARRSSPVLRRPSFVARRPSPVVRRSSSVAIRRHPSPAVRPSSVVRRPSVVVRRPPSVGRASPAVRRPSSVARPSPAVRPSPVVRRPSPSACLCPSVHCRPFVDCCPLFVEPRMAEGRERFVACRPTEPSRCLAHPSASCIARD